MGEVYLGRDTRLDRLAALKILPPQVAADPDRIDRFTREAKTASTLNHPNIGSIYDVGEADGLRFFAMEYVEGHTLASRIAGRALGAPDIVAIGRQVAEALEAAHARSIVHRDIKPENVMVRLDGYVKVLDFGLAKLTEPAPPSGPDAQTGANAATTPGLIVGTVHYMSPEQARGQPVDHRTDLFSLGVVLYEMATGQRPFRGATSLDVLAAILHEDPAPLSDVASNVPLELSAIVAKALRKDPEARYQSAKDLLNDLKALQATGVRPVPVPAALKRTWFSARIGAAALGLGVIVAAAAYFGRDAGRGPIDSIAVLPLANSGTSPDTEYLADGLTDSIIADLSDLPDLRVVARSSVWRFKGKAVDPPTAGRELHVQALVIGRVEARGDRLSIAVELVDARDSRRLWGETYDRPAGDLLLVREHIARAVRSDLQARRGVTATALVPAPATTDVEAYQFLLKGAFSYRKLTEAGLKQAVDYYLQALQRDSNYALAHVGLAESYIVLGADYWPPVEAMPKAAAHATRALQLAPDLPGAHAAMGIIRLVYDWNWAEAEKELRQQRVRQSDAIESLSCALHYADPVGRNAEAIAALESALAADPISLATNLELGCASYYGRHFDRSIRQFTDTIALYPDHPGLVFGLSRAYTQKGLYAAAIAALTPARALSGDWPPIISELGYAHARAGNIAQAKALGAELERQSATRFVDPYLLAVIAIGLGDRDRALRHLGQAVAVRSGWLPWLKIEPKWDDLHADARFAALLRRIGLSM